MNSVLKIFTSLAFLTFVIIGCGAQNEITTKSTTNNMDATTNKEGLESATFGNGCFWCSEAVFQELNGVESVESGYSGGHVENPTYEQIGTKKTGHAEVIRITYDPNIISYAEVLEVFWVTHDPTTLNRQGNDVGPQYRSAVYYHDDAQKEMAEALKKQLDEAKIWNDPIVTEISPLINYYVAEDYHQNYYRRVGNGNSYCTYVINPKMEKFRKAFKEKLKKKQ